MKQKTPYLPVVMMIFLFGMISFVTNLAVPMGVVLKNQFGISNFLGMLGNFATFIAYAIMGIPAGKMLERYGFKRTALIAIAVGITGLVLQYCSGHLASFPVYLLGAFICGFCVCMLNTVVNPMLNTLGGGGNKGNQLLQIGGTFNSLNATIVPMLVGALVGDVARAQISDVYPVMYIAIGIFVLCFFVLSFVRIPEPHVNKTAAATVGEKQYSPWNFRHFVLGAIGIFVYVGVEVGIPGTLNLFLSDAKSGTGLHPETAAAIAGFVAGTYWFLMLIGRFLGGLIGGKVSGKTMLTVASVIAILLVLAAIFSPVTTTLSMPVFTGSSFTLTQVPISAFFLVLVGLCTSVMWGGIFNLAVEGLGKYVAAASGIFMMMVCGGGILPSVQNWVADHTSYLLSYWVPLAGFVYLLIYALAGSKNVSKHIPV